jgi:P pilus assembly chaperone PapD
MVVELTPSSRTADVLVFNDADERAYVSIEPTEVVDPGTPGEKRISNPDPRVFGLLLSSTRLILEPRQKRLLRLASTSIPNEKERVYRVIVKPVVGDVESKASGLKLLVGYEMLIMVRPAKAGPVSIEARRTSNELTLTNKGGASVELTDGQRCLPANGKCTPLPAKRLYAGASWTQTVPLGGRIEYRALTNGTTETLRF